MREKKRGQKIGLCDVFRIRKYVVETMSFSGIQIKSNAITVLLCVNPNSQKETKRDQTISSPRRHRCQYVDYEAPRKRD